MDRLLAAIQTLQKAGNAEDPLFLAHGLDLLVGHLGAELAVLVSVEGPCFETRWWSPDRGENDPPPPVQAFCRWLADHPQRTLVLRDIPKDGRLGKLAELQGRGIQSALGAALWRGGEVKAMVFAHFRKPRAFGRAELALLGAVAGFMGRMLEVEDLKAALARVENALAITKAVMEDSSIQDPATDLPNLRYLDIWLKANLEGGRPPQPMAVALFRASAGSRKDAGRLRRAAEQIRGSDLLVAAGEDRFLVLLLGATKGLAHILLTRLRNQMEGCAMGATLWLPGLDDPALDSARKRAEAALQDSMANPPAGVSWNLPESLLPPQAAIAIPEPETELPVGPALWRPKTLGEQASPGTHPNPPARKELAIILPRPARSRRR